MTSFNKVILAGNLTRDPQLSYTQGGTPVCEIGLAVNHKYKTQGGEDREEVCFVDCKCFGRQAEVLNQYMARGRSLLVEGRLQFDQWEHEGRKYSKHTIFIQSFTFLGSAGSGDQQSQSGGGQSNYSNVSNNATSSQQPRRTPANPRSDHLFNGDQQPAGDNLQEEDIPF